jgi:hypothetical protein
LFLPLIVKQRLVSKDLRGAEQAAGVMLPQDVSRVWLGSIDSTSTITRLEAERSIAKLFAAQHQLLRSPPMCLVTLIRWIALMAVQGSHLLQIVRQQAPP